jgi:hypothetical protein
MAARRRILKRVAIVVAVLVAAHIAWTYLEKREFERRIADLRAANQPIYTTDLATVPIPDEQNAAALLEQAAAWLEENRDTSRDQNLSFAFQPGAMEHWEEFEGEKITAYLEKLAPYYAMLDEIPKRPGWWLDLRWEDGPAVHVRAVGWVMEALEYVRYRVAFDPVEAGRTERAARAAVFLLDLADRCKLPFSIGHFTVESVRDSDEILRLAEKQPGFDARLFRKMVDPRLARTLGQRGPPTTPLRQDRTIALWILRSWLADDSIEIPNVADWDDRIERSVLWRPMLYRDACRTLEKFERVIACCGARPEDAYATGLRLWEEREETSVNWSLTRRTSLVHDDLFLEYAASTARRRLTRVAMALLEYRQTRGDWPQDLTLLGKMPLDPYTEAPFLYERRGRGARIRPVRSGGDDDDGVDEENLWQLLVWDHLAWSWEE